MQGRRFDRNSQDFGRAPPVNVGDELDVKIEAVGEKGDGVAKKDGFVLFVPNVKENDNVRIKVTRVLRKVGFAEVIGKSQGPVKKEESAPVEEAEEDFSEEKDSDNFGEEDSTEESTDDASSDDFGEEKKDEDSDAFGEVSDDEPSEDFSEDEEDKK